MRATGAGHDRTGEQAPPAGGQPAPAARQSRPAESRGPLIAGLAIADPPRVLDQRAVLELVGLAGDEFAERIFARCGVERRRLDLDAAMLASNLQGRTERVEQLLLDYSATAVEALGIDPRRIGTVITSSLYSLGCPTLAHRLIERFDMDRGSDKYHILGVGCASAIPLVRLGSQALAGHPDKQVLIVAAESMSGLICSATDADPRSKTVATSIFGDGCAAMLLDAGEDSAGHAGQMGMCRELARAPELIDSQMHQIPDTLAAVRIDTTEREGFLGLVRELPDIAGDNLRPLVDAFLARNGLTGHMIDHWIIHPGGRRIIECAQQALALPDDELAVSYEALAEHGNVGTPSIFYVLAETIEKRDPAPGQVGLMVTIGPGVSVGLMLVRF